MSLPTMLSRRRFVSALGAASVGTIGVVGARALGGQGAVATGGDEPLGTMEGDGYLPVTRPPKAGAKPSMSAEARDDVEHMLSCPCPCTLDVFTCRTSMPCGFSPRMHSDVMRLVDGGYSADEIIAAFTDTYGEKVLMAPKREGFNLAGYLMPFVALGTGAVVVAALIRRWGARAAAAPISPTASRDVDASPDELARLDAAIRGDRP